MGNKFSNFFYHEVKDVVEHRQSLRFKAVHMLNIGINICFILRFAYIILARSYPQLALSEQDIFVRIFNLDKKTSDKDYSIIFTFIGMSISSALLEAKLYFSRVDTLTWQMFYDLVVRNTDIYRASLKAAPIRRKIYENKVNGMKQQSATGHAVPALWNNVKSKVKASASLWYNLDYVNKEKLFATKLDNYPEMTLQLRTRLVVALSISNKISTSCILALYVSFISFAVYYFLQIINEFPLWYIPIVAVELTYFSYMNIRILEILIFETNLASSSAILFISYIQEANEGLFQVQEAERVRPTKSKMAEAVWLFLRKHTLISHQIMFAGEEMWGTVLLITMCNHIPNNAYMMVRILMGSKSLITWVMAAVQIVYILITLLFLAAYSKVLHTAKGFLNSVQILLRKQFLLTKWKTLDIYEMLNNGKQIGITIGPSATITFRIVFEIVLYYVALLLFIIKSFH